MVQSRHKPPEGPSCIDAKVDAAKPKRRAKKVPLVPVVSETTCSAGNEPPVTMPMPMPYWANTGLHAALGQIGEQMEFIKAGLDKSELHDALDKVGKQVEWVQRSMALVGVAILAVLLIVLLK